MKLIIMVAYFECIAMGLMFYVNVSALTLQNQTQNRSRQTKFSLSTTEPGSGSVVTPSNLVASDSNSDTAIYRFITSNSGTCILLKTDAMVEVNFLLNNLPEKADAYLPKDALVDGDCQEDASFLSISWKGYRLLLNFAKTPGGERWYISNVELTVSPDLPQVRGIQTRGKLIKLYHRDTLIPTPVGKSYSCDEVDIDLVPDDTDGPPGLHGTLLLRKLQLQPFMYKSENFELSFECKPQRLYRDETAPIAVGSTLAVAVLMTVTGYGVFRYFKIKNVQYNTME